MKVLPLGKQIGIIGIIENSIKIDGKPETYIFQNG